MFYLALQLLQVGMQVKIIEKDSSRCETCVSFFLRQP